MALLVCAINEKYCSVDGGWGIWLFFFVPTRRGIWELKSPSPREIAIQGRKNGYAMVSARRGTGGVLGEAAGA